jgi:regulator of replication initiation timing
LRSRVAELGTENRRLQIENVGLKNEVGELETVNSELRARIAELVEKSPASAPPPPITVS